MQNTTEFILGLPIIMSFPDTPENYEPLNFQPSPTKKFVFREGPTMHLQMGAVDTPWHSLLCTMKTVHVDQFSVSHKKDTKRCPKPPEVDPEEIEVCVFYIFYY
jgi:hypothetical protein